MRSLATRLLVGLLSATPALAQRAEDLVPYKPPQKEAGPSADPGGAQPPSEWKRKAANEAAAFHFKARAAVEQLKADRPYAYAELEDVLLETRSWLGRRVSVLAFPSSVKIATDKPSGSLTSSFGIVSITASFAGLSAAERKELLRISSGSGRRLVAFRGWVRGAAGAPFLDVDGTLDLGAVPPHSPQSVADILASPEPQEWGSEEERLQALATLERLKKEAGAAFVPVEDLLFEPERFEGKLVETAGPTWQLSLGELPSVRLSNSFAARDLIQVTLERLPKPALKAMMRHHGGSVFISVRGRVLRAPNGAFYLQAVRAAYLGAWGSIGALYRPPPAFRRGRGGGKGMVWRASEDRDAGVAALRAKAEAALKEGRKRADYEVVEVEDLLVAPRRYAGRRVQLLGVPSNCQEGPQGRFCSVSFSFGDASRVPISLSRLPAARAEAAARAWEKPGTLALLMLAVREQGGAMFGEVEDFIEVGTPPQGVMPRPDELLAFVPGVREPTTADVRERLQAVVDELKADREYRYVRFEDIVVEPGPLYGKRVSLLGVLHQIEVGGSSPSLTVSTAWAGSENIAVSIARLPLAAHKRLLRLRFPPNVIAVKGAVRASANGGLFIDADAVVEGARDSGNAISEVR